jgi:hypothetical protein
MGLRIIEAWRQESKNLAKTLAEDGQMKLSRKSFPIFITESVAQPVDHILDLENIDNGKGQTLE